LLAVVRNFARKWKEQTASVTVSHAYQSFLEHQEAEGGSVRHLASLKSRVGRLEADKGTEIVSSVDAGAFSDWLNGLRATRADKEGEKLGMVTRDNLKKSCRSFFAYCIGRGWASANPVPVTAKKRTREHRLAKRKAPAIMLPAEVAKFLCMVEAVAPKILSFWCVKFFAGIRDAEAARMTWDMVDLKAGKIRLPASITKTGDMREVKILPVLRAWLELHPEREGPLAPPSAIARRFAYKKVLKRLRAPLEKGGAKQVFDFPSNAARHSFGTFHLYRFRKPGETALQMGHKGDPAMLHEHYSNPAAQQHAKAFWEIMPAAPAGNVVSIKRGRKTA
jgi:integrase